MNKSMNFAGRVLMAQIFLLSGISKVSAYTATQGYMDSMGVPGGLLPAVIALEIGAAVALIIGFQTRLAAVALAGFAVVSAFIFHADFADQMQMIMLMKNLAMAGGLLAIAAAQTGDTLSIDAYRLKYTHS